MDSINRSVRFNNKSAAEKVVDFLEKTAVECEKIVDGISFSEVCESYSSESIELTFNTNLEPSYIVKDNSICIKNINYDRKKAETIVNKVLNFYKEKLTGSKASELGIYRMDVDNDYSFNGKAIIAVKLKII